MLYGTIGGGAWLFSSISGDFVCVCVCVCLSLCLFVCVTAPSCIFQRALGPPPIDKVGMCVCARLCKIPSRECNFTVMGSTGAGGSSRGIALAAISSSRGGGGVGPRWAATPPSCSESRRAPVPDGDTLTTLVAVRGGKWGVGWVVGGKW